MISVDRKLLYQKLYFGKISAMVELMQMDLMYFGKFIVFKLLRCEFYLKNCRFQEA
jgi:hypothetical protein